MAPPKRGHAASVGVGRIFVLLAQANGDLSVHGERVEAQVEASVLVGPGGADRDPEGFAVFAAITDREAGVRWCRHSLSPLLWRPPQRGLDATRHGVGPRHRRGETRRGITRLGRQRSAESRGHRVEGDSLHPEEAGCAVGFALIEDMLIESGLRRRRYHDSIPPRDTSAFTTRERLDEKQPYIVDMESWSGHIAPRLRFICASQVHNQRAAVQR